MPLHDGDVSRVALKPVFVLARKMITWLSFEPCETKHVIKAINPQTWSRKIPVGDTLFFLSRNMFNIHGILWL